MVTEESVLIGRLNNLCKLTGELLMKSKKEKLMQPKTRATVVEINSCAVMALLSAKQIENDKLPSFLQGSRANAEYVGPSF